MKPETDEEKRNLKKSLQKVLEKFGGLKKMLYLCTTFRFEIERSGFSNGSLIYWYNKRENVVFYLSILLKEYEVVRTLTIHYNFYNGEFDPGSG